MSSPKITWMLLSTDVSDQPSNLPSLAVADHICIHITQPRAGRYLHMIIAPRPIHIGLLCSRRQNQERSRRGERQTKHYFLHFTIPVLHCIT
uniref:Uncharacterized protein n=1 Tax=Triticum urartu TaxID=4572 RepID=A0A8R7PCR8_TRIUA